MCKRDIFNIMINSVVGVKIKGCGVIVLSDYRGCIDSKVWVIRVGEEN